MEFLNGSYLFVYFVGKLQQYEIARLDENLTFTYSNNETNETVWPGESMHISATIFKDPSHLNRGALFMVYSASGGYTNQKLSCCL